VRELWPAAALAARPVSGSAIERLVDEVEASLQGSGSQVTSEEIGRVVLERLRDLDEVAYLRFASVYKEFQGAADFEKEVAALESAE
jgi:transcriptional repressor NrdR